MLNNIVADTWEGVVFDAVPNDKPVRVDVEGEGEIIVCLRVDGVDASINVQNIKKVEDGGDVFLKGGLWAFVSDLAGLKMEARATASGVLAALRMFTERNELG